MMNKQLVSLFAITLLQPAFAMEIIDDLNAQLLGIRDDVVDLGHLQDLLARGAQISARDESGDTALTKYTKRNYYPECKIVITNSQFGLPENLETSIDAILQYKLKLLKPLMAEAMALAKDKDLRALLDPDNLKEGSELIDEIKKNIQKKIEPENSGFFSWFR